MYDFVDDKSKPTGPKPTGPKPTEKAKGAGSVDDQAVIMDQVSRKQEEIFRGHVGEFSISLHGKDHPEALFRAAGGESNERFGSVDLAEPRILYRCPCCGQAASRVIRVRASRRSAWAGVCAMCAASLLAKNPEAVVGGRVRPSSRRRPKRLRDAG